MVTPWGVHGVARLFLDVADVAGDGLDGCPHGVGYCFSPTNAPASSHSRHASAFVPYCLPEYTSRPTTGSQRPSPTEILGRRALAKERQEFLQLSNLSV